jgi:hypothetical protein
MLLERQGCEHPGDGAIHRAAFPIEDNNNNNRCSNFSDEASSVISQDEALCNILGLASLNDVTFMEEEVLPDIIPSPLTLKPTAPVRLKLPKHVSRYCFSPNQCCAWTIPNLFLAEECEQLIQTATTSSTNASFDYIRTAMHTAADGSTYQVNLQNPNPHKLAVFQHPTWVERLWERIQPYVQGDASILKEMMERDDLEKDAVAGLNPRLRVLKYDAQDHDEFQAHFDATTTLEGDKTSFITVLIYLNDGGGLDFEGGETVFMPNTIHTSQQGHAGRRVNLAATNEVIEPSTGTVVLFEHDLFHCGSPLKRGTKYVLRTDIMFNLSQDELQQLRSRQRNNQQQNQNKHDDTVDAATGKASTITVEALLREIHENDETNQLLTGGLDDLGLLEDTSIETFCAPGRFALQAMLQDVLLTTMAATTTQDEIVKQKVLIIRAINAFLDAAFEACN